MPYTAADLHLREFVDHTGDTGAYPLPVGNPASGVHNPRKADFRAAMNGALDGVIAYVEAAEAAADLAALYAPAYFNDFAAMWANTTAWPAGQILNVRLGGYVYEVAASGATDHHLTRPDGVKLYLRGNTLTQAQAPGAQIARIAYGLGASLIVKTGESIALVCDPSGGDNLQAMAKWISSRGHYVDQGGELYLQIADGLHNVSTYIDIVDGGQLDVRATAMPDFLTVTSATFSATTGDLTATVNVSAGTPLPARVVAGFAVGGLNIQGDGGADILNCGMIVKARVSNTQFTADIFSSGVALSAFTTPDNTATLGLTPNQLMVPKCTIRAAEAGWDGAAREAFMNVLRGGKIGLTHVGLSYNGAAGDNDMLFARDAGSEIYLRDYCVVAGTGEMVARSFNYGNIITNRSCLGGGQTGANIWQGSGGGTLTAVRTMMGSVSADAISTSAGGKVFATACVVAGANILARTTYVDASLTLANCRLSRGNLGVAPTDGNITIDSNSSIKACTTPISITSSQSGTVSGDPTISGNTNATVTPFEVQASGGVWLPSASRPVDASLYAIGRFSGSLNFPSIAAGSFADLTITATGADFNDFCLISRSGSAEPAQAVDFRAFVSAANTVTVRAFNVSSAAIDPTAFTGLVLVLRSA